MTLKILIAGKDKSLFHTVKDVFEDEDAHIIVATSIGLALFLTRKNQPEVIIAQEELADSDGLSFYYELQNEDELANIPFILLVEDISRLQAAKHNMSKDNLHFVSRQEVQSANVNRLKEKIMAYLDSP
jgi:DNA-binding response OmpR family regulator